MSEHFKVMSIVDPAVDWGRGAVTSKAIDEYIRTRDPETIQAVLKPGAMPTWFYLREIPQDLWESFVDAEQKNEALKYRRAFQAAFVRVENLVGEQGQVLGRDFEPASVVSNGCLLDEECRRFAPSERLEIGGVAYQRSFFPKRIGAIFHLPHSLVEQWEMRTLQLAAQSLALLPPSSGSGSSASSAQTASRPTDLTTSRPDAKPDSRTGATARAGSRSERRARRKRQRRG